MPTGRPRSPHAAYSRLGSMQVLTVFAVFALILADLAPIVLPKKYFGDAGYIQLIALGASPTVPDSSYLSTGQLYAMFHLGMHPQIVATIAISLYYFSLRRAFHFSPFESLPLKTLVLACASLLLAAIYVAPFSKEFVVLIAVGLILSLVGRPGSIITITLFVLAYAVFFRSYWFLVAVLFVLILGFLRFMPTRIGLVLALVASVILAGFALQFVNHESLNSLRLGLNAARTGAPDAVTLIPEYIGGDSVLSGILNALVTLMTLLVPIPLLIHAAPQYFAAGVLFLFISINVGGMWLQVGRQLQGSDSRHVPAGLRVQRPLLALTIAMYVVQSLYVPDYGSALKHVTPVIPLIVAALACSTKLQRPNVKSRAPEGTPVGATGA